MHHYNSHVAYKWSAHPLGHNPLNSTLEEIIKNTFRYIFLCFLLFVVTCKENSTQAPNDSGLVGTWLWKQTTGGIGGWTTFPPGNNKYLLRITKDNNFIESRNDTITFSDNFVTYIDSTYKKQVIDFINSKRFSMVIERISSDSLSLWDGFIDGYFSFYTRVK